MYKSSAEFKRDESQAKIFLLSLTLTFATLREVADLSGTSPAGTFLSRTFPSQTRATYSCAVGTRRRMMAATRVPWPSRSWTSVSAFRIFRAKLILPVTLESCVVASSLASRIPKSPCLFLKKDSTLLLFRSPFFRSRPVSMTAILTGVSCCWNWQRFL